MTGKNSIRTNSIVPKPAGTPATYTPSAAALAIAAAEKERVAKRTAEEAFDKVHSLKKSIRELDGNENPRFSLRYCDRI